MLLADKKTIQLLGSRMNDSAASKPSDFALRMMQKMGWKEGQGLGKNEDGIADHIVIKKRDDNVGLGLENNKAADAVAENWWHNSFSSSLAAFKVGLPGKGKSEKKKSKKDKKESKKESKKDSTNKTDNNSNNGDNDPFAPPSYEELFKATGGKRLGMRARMDQKGKFLRTEQQPSTSSSAANNKEESSAQTAEEKKKLNENSDATTEEEERKEKTSKKEKKEKKEKRKSDDEDKDEEKEKEKKERKESKKSKKNDDDSPKKKKQKTSQ